MKGDDPEESSRIVEEVVEKVLSGIKLGVNWSELKILEDENSSKAKIQELGAKIATKNPETSATILAIAHSIYFDHSRGGSAPDFFDAYLRLGAERIKILFFFLALSSLGKGPDGRRRAAKSAGISILGRIIAQQMGLKDELVRKVEAGGLLCQIGRNVFMKARELGMEIDDEFIDAHEVDLATRVVKKLGLDSFLLKAVDMSYVDFDEDSFSLGGIVKLAESLTENSFDRYGKLVLQSPMPDRYDVVTKSPGDVVQRHFSILGVGEYLEVREVPTPRQLEAIRKH
ncbi:MAG: LLM class flavin-dependent oxidoreductase [Deltaproteobacteria bacterium]|nr:LLM class flavin-dependent oxidoreductase [Deltaproteobacteria bacterium]